MNEGYVLRVAKAALEDLVSAREEFGQGSAEHKKQAERSAGFIHGSLEAVLTAAIPNLEIRTRDARSQTTQTD